MQPTSTNPLAKHFRQPAIYMSLPSGGKYWPEGSLDLPENGELPVYGLTVKDEIMIRTPDALFSGHSTVSVIKSCIPNIIEPWRIPSIDLDAILAAAKVELAGFKRPRHFVIVEALPRNTMGKVQKAEMRKTYADVFQA